MVSNLSDIAPKFSGRTRLVSSYVVYYVLSAVCAKNCSEHFICNNSFNHYNLILAMGKQIQ